jgi:hypothetical protein
VWERKYYQTDRFQNNWFVYLYSYRSNPNTYSIKVLLNCIIWPALNNFEGVMPEQSVIIIMRQIAVRFGLFASIIDHS